MNVCFSKFTSGVGNNKSIDNVDHSLHYIMTVTVKSVNNMTSSTMTSRTSYSQLLPFTLPPPPPLPSPIICHHLNMFFLIHLSHSFTHPPSPPHPIPTPPPLPTFLPPSLLSNYIQRYTGGSWVRRQTGSSGEWWKSCSGPLTLLLLLFFLLHPPATACLMSACHVRLLPCFPCLSSPFFFLK